MPPLTVSEYFHPGVALDSGWELLCTPAGEIQSPAALGERAWTCASLPGRKVPGTPAASLRSNGELRRATDPDFDAQDYFYRVRFSSRDWPVVKGEPCAYLLVFHGLATLATVWFNGQAVLETQSMFRRYAVDVSQLLRGESAAAENELVLQFRALLPAMKAKKGPRRWPTRLVEHRNLRYFRTSLLGRMPGWTPPWPVVGPFRSVHLVTQSSCLLRELHCEPSIDHSGAKVHLRLTCQVPAPTAKLTATLHVGGQQRSITLQRTVDPAAPPNTESAAEAVFSADVDLRFSGLETWWPHTHGAQPLYAARLVLEGAGNQQDFQLPALGFRSVRLLPNAEFGFEINGVAIFCRGACWAPLDVVTLHASEPELRAALLQVKAAGMNMLRISGTLSYELPLFHRLCDELGILVWQDFMLANMDYPRGDAEFDAEIDVEARQVIERLAASCSTALVCGGSETEQQAAMMGLPQSQWEHPVWREQLPKLMRQLYASVPYFYATPGGAGLPFWPEDGCTHYYGVGAYMRPLTDARLTQIRFASECLAFANLPDAHTAEGLLASGGDIRGRVPQDNGASWDFGDVTDHYITVLFGVDPKQLRKEEPTRYLELAQRTTARVMYEAQTHFRDPATACRGTLIWMLRDLEPGSGWGIIDSAGNPKSGYHALTQIWQPRAVWLVNEGLSGLTVVVANDPGTELKGELTVQVCRDTHQVVEEYRGEVRVAAHSAVRLRVEELFGKFLDTSHSYRFGPPGFSYLRATVTIEGETQHLTTTSLAPDQPG